MAEQLRIVIDRGRCMGSGNCHFFAGNTFDLDEEDKAIIVDPSGDDKAAQRMAVENCPTAALSIADSGTSD